MGYTDTLLQIAEYVLDERLKALIVQLSNDLDVEFKATIVYNETLLEALTTAINDFKVMTGERYVKLEHKVVESTSGVQNKVHHLANLVSALQYKIEDLVELMTKERD